MRYFDLLVLFTSVYNVLKFQILPRFLYLPLSLPITSYYRISTSLWEERLRPVSLKGGTLNPGTHVYWTVPSTIEIILCFSPSLYSSINSVRRTFFLVFDNFVISLLFSSLYFICIFNENLLPLTTIVLCLSSSTFFFVQYLWPIFFIFLTLFLVLLTWLIV